MVRVAFPHSRFPDGPYERTADIILKEAAASNWFRVSLTQGLGSLDGLAGGDFCSLDDDKAYKVLKSIEGTDFFGFIRRTTVLNLYDDPAVWEALGYEGSVLRQGRVHQPRLQRSELAARATDRRVRRPGDVRTDLGGPGSAPPTATALWPTPASAGGRRSPGQPQGHPVHPAGPTRGRTPGGRNSAKAGV